MIMAYCSMQLILSVKGLLLLFPTAWYCVGLMGEKSVEAQIMKLKLGKTLFPPYLHRSCGGRCLEGFFSQMRIGDPGCPVNSYR